MFGSNFVEIGIGLALLFLLLSLMCSFSSETVSRWLSWRANTLEVGIRELLHDPAVADQLYRHPLIKGLGQKNVPDASRHARRLARFPSFQARLQKRIDAWSKPSYIPSQLFARALLDTILLMPRTGPCRALRDAVRRHTDEAIKRLEARVEAAEFDSTEALSKRLKAIDDSLQGLKDEAERERLLGLVANLREAAGVTSSAEPMLDQIRAAIDKLEDRDLRRALVVLLNREEVADIAAARAAVAQWFDDGMDRVSGWYKRKSQRLVFIIAFFVTIALNIDTLLIADRLSRDATLRSLVVAAADGAGDELKDLRQALPSARTSSTPAPSIPGAASPNPTGISAPAQTRAAPGGPPSPNRHAAVSPGEPATPTTPATVAPPSAELSPGSPAAATALDGAAQNGAAEVGLTEDLGASYARYQRLRAEIDQLHLPIGWPTAEEIEKAASQRASKERAAEAAALLERAATERAENAAKAQATCEGAVKGLAPSTAKDAIEKAIADADKAAADAERARNEADAARSSAAKARIEAAIAAREAMNERGFPTDWKHRLMRVLGWLFTAFAASLGAQFWFDVLSKIMNLRTSGKRPEKST